MRLSPEKANREPNSALVSKVCRPWQTYLRHAASGVRAFLENTVYYSLPKVAFAAILLLSSLSLAESEQGGDLSAAESQALVRKILSSPDIIERLSPEKREELSRSTSFQNAILAKEQDFLDKRSISEAAVLKRVVQALYSPQSELALRFEALNVFGERLEYLVATRNLPALLKMRQEDLSELQSGLLERQLLTFTRSTANELIATGKSSDAIELLTQLPESSWKEIGRQLTLSVIGGMTKDGSELTSEQLRKFSERLKETVQKEPGAKQAVINIIEHNILTASKRGDMPETKERLRLLRELFSEQFRAEFLEQLLLEQSSTIDNELSDALVQELKERGALSVRLKLKLMVGGYYGPIIPILIWLTVLFPTLGFVVFLGVFLRKKVSTIKISLPRREKKLPGYMKPVLVEQRENEDEYTRLLALFNLADSASEEDIKKAYRARMKTLHPDQLHPDRAAAGAVDLGNSEEFRELKFAYDRILEIRGAWFRGRKGK
jgi:hypothetical protein